MTAALLLAVASVQLECTYDFVRVPAEAMVGEQKSVVLERGRASVTKQGNQIEIVEVIAGKTTRRKQKLPFLVDAKAELEEFLLQTRSGPTATQWEAGIREKLKSATISSILSAASVKIDGIPCRIQHNFTTVDEQLSLSYTTYIPSDPTLQERIGFLQRTLIVDWGYLHVYQSETKSNIKWKPIQ